MEAACWFSGSVETVSVKVISPDAEETSSRVKPPVANPQIQVRVRRRRGHLPERGVPAAAGPRDKCFASCKGSAAAIAPRGFALGKSFCKAKPKRLLAQNGRDGVRLAPGYVRGAGLSVCGF